MSTQRERYPFVIRNATAGVASLAPVLPLRLRLDSLEMAVSGLIDTGATVNVLPWTIGKSLGGNWNALPPITLSG